MSKAYELISKRRLVGGPYDAYRGMTPLRYPWAHEIWTQMLANTWFPTEVNLLDDRKRYDTLDQGSRIAYDRALSFLANLDAIQVENLSRNIVSIITAPEVARCINRQLYEEELHVTSYSTMIESISMDPEEIYFMPLEDKILEQKNDFILRQARHINDDKTELSILLAMVSNVILEGIYFYSGFATFYTLARAGNMIGSSNMIKFIQRDEEVHLELFLNMIRSYMLEIGRDITDFETEIKDLFTGAVALETAWGKHIIEKGVIGLTDGIVTDYIGYLADDRLKRMGLDPIYGVKNPIPWVDKFSKINVASTSYFEVKPTDYAKGGVVW
jgi:ribonucleoside-diphosphate reductase beta chain